MRMKVLLSISNDQTKQRELLLSPRYGSMPYFLTPLFGLQVDREYCIVTPVTPFTCK